MNPAAEEQVVLVNEADEPIGQMEKLAAHRQGRLHRAFSVFGFDAEGRLLLQKRAASKYHSGGLWTNTCCSHPRPGESIAAAAGRRLREELGLEFPVEPAFTFLYRAPMANGLEEHELDHVLFGRVAGKPRPDPAEVEDWRYVTLAGLERELREHPDAFTAWLKVCFPEVKRRREEL